MGVFGLGPGIVDAGAAAVEGVRRIRDYMDGEDYESLTDEELEQWADENGFTYSRENGVTRFEPETEEAEEVVEEAEALVDEDYPMARRMLESGPRIWALEAGEFEAEDGNGYEDESSDVNDTGGENTMEPTAEELRSRGEQVIDVTGNDDVYEDDLPDAFANEAYGVAFEMVAAERSGPDSDYDFEELVEYAQEQGIMEQVQDYKADLVTDVAGVQGLYDEIVEQTEQRAVERGMGATMERQLQALGVEQAQGTRDVAQAHNDTEEVYERGRQVTADSARAVNTILNLTNEARELKGLDAEDVEDVEEDLEYLEAVSGTVEDARDAIDDMEDPDFERLLELEQQHKDRTTLTEYLERQVE